MGLTVNISSVSGVTPYQVFLCQPDGTGCIYIDETSVIPFQFNIPAPYDQSVSYMVKIIDGEGCTITNVASL